MQKNLLFHASKVQVQTKYIYFEWVPKKIITNSKINPNFTGHIFCCYLSIQKVSHWKSYATFISTTNPTGYYTSLWNFFGDSPAYKWRTLSRVRNAVNFFHSILAWNQEICTIPMIFRHCMLFLVFSEGPCTRLWSSFLIKMLQLLSSFAHTASVLIQVHEYHIFIHWFQNFEPLLILNLLRWIIPRKQKN